MSGNHRMSGRHRRYRFRLTPWGWMLTMALVVLVVLAIVASSPAVYVGLIAVIVIWAALLSSSYPSARRGAGRVSAEMRQDPGQEAAERYGREHPLD